MTDDLSGIENELSKRLSHSQPKLGRGWGQDRLVITFALLVALLSLATTLFVLLRAKTGARNASISKTVRQTGWTAEDQQRLASKLKAQGLTAEAALAYEKAANLVRKPSSKQSNLCLAAAELWMDAGNYERAMTMLNRAEMLHPSPEVKKEIDERIVTCLERLGKPLDASFELAQRTALDKQSQPKNPSDIVVARVGSRKITMREIDHEIEKLPPSLRQSFSDNEGRLRFLQQYAQQLVLYDHARRMGYDKDPAVRKQIEDQARNILINAVIEKEIEQKVQVTPDEARLYYQAHKDVFTEPERATVAHILVKDKAKAERLLKQILNGKLSFEKVVRTESLDKASAKNDGTLQAPIVKGQSHPAFPGAKDLAAKVLQFQNGAVVPEVIEAQNGYHIVKVMKRTAARLKPFKEVAQQAAAMYRMEKQQAMLKQLLQKLMQAEKVEIYAEKFGAGTPSSADDARGVKP